MLKKIKNANIYTALGICAVALAVAAVISVVPDKTDASEETGFSRVSIKWSERSTEQTVPETAAVDIGVTGIEDDRNETETTTENNKPFTGSFVLPMGNDITKDFSNGEMVFNRTMGDWRVHNGVDFGGASGNRVNAVADGEVVSIYKDSFLGTVVEIDHGNGMTVSYCGLKEGTTLAKGTFVKAGEKIGTLGTVPSETADGEHLHLEIKVDGKTVDPLAALNRVREE